MAKSSRVKVTKRKPLKRKPEARKTVSDFKKKRAKVGKKLAKPKNETITTFKSRSIIIDEQLAAKESGPDTTNKRYNLQDLILRFKKNNSKQKGEACKGVKEILGKLSPAKVRGSLSSLLSALTPCLLDDDTKVRNMAIQLVGIVIDIVGRDAMLPHVGLLGAHISCTLVSLHSNIQVTGLNTLHMLVSKAPSLLPKLPESVMRNLLSLLGAKTKDGTTLLKTFTNAIGGKYTIVPKKKTDFDKKKMTKKEAKADTEGAGRLSSKKNTTLWQLDVLVLLTSIIEQVVANAGGGGGPVPTPRTQAEVLLLHYLPSKNLHTTALDCNTIASSLQEEATLRRLVGLLLPIAHKLWTHLLPEGAMLNEGLAMSLPSGHCLCSISSLLQHFGALTQMCRGSPAHSCGWFSSSARPIVGDILGKHFPFHFEGGGRSARSPTYEHSPPRSHDDLNVHLASLGVQYQVISEREGTVQASYVSALLHSHDKVGTYSMENAASLVTKLVAFFAARRPFVAQDESMDDSDESLVAIDQMMTAALECYKNLHPLKKEKKTLLQGLLLEVTADHRDTFYTLPCTLAWVTFLLYEVKCSPCVTAELLATVQQLCLRRAIRGLPGKLPDAVQGNLKSNPVGEKQRNQTISLLQRAVKCS